MSKLRWWVSRLLPVTLALLVLGVCAYRYSTFRITKNFAEIDPGKFYRSAQLTPSELADAIDHYGIKTVISLRGAPEHAIWYRAQKDLLSRKGVDFHALWWSSEEFPTKSGLVEYLDILKTAKYPILVHCRTGADRTGEATAIYAIEHMNEKRDEAIRKYLNFNYWHVRLFKPAMSEFIRRYAGEAWARTEYDDCAPENLKYTDPAHCHPPATSSSQTH